MNTVCIDCRYVGAKPSGIGELVHSLIRQLPGLAPDLNFLLLKSAKRDEPLSVASNVEEVPIESPANGPATMWWLPRIVDFRAIDVFHATFNILPAGIKKPTLTTIHDIMWLTHPQWCNPSLYGQIERKFYAHGIRRALKHATHIATVSSATRAAILERHPDLKDKISVTLSGVSDRFRPVDVNTAVLRDLGIAPGKKIILSVGQYSPYKNHDGALAGFAAAFKDRSDVALVMVQRRNKNTAQMMSLANSLGIADRIYLTGPISEQSLITLYSAASALLHPSLCEGFGNPLAEAMACGCPVVTSNLSAMPEVTANAAALVDPYDSMHIGRALRSVVDDANHAGTMREKGLARAAQLSWHTFAQQHLKIYRALLA